jgi:8-oxo-dGTP pyrophosphatase MutT (NUDIX family)
MYSGRRVSGPPQQIPRPPSFRPGGSPPWAALPESARRGVTLDRVRAVMGHVGPVDPTPALPYAGSPAAVLVPLFEEDGEARVILTRRSPHLRSHTHQVSFPGGRLDEGELPLAAALREASEEIGLDPAAVDIVGELGPLGTLSQGAYITPIVGVLRGRPMLTPNPHEVEHVFDVSLAQLLDPAVFREERWDTPFGIDRPVYFFNLPHDIVWGATARILHELLSLVRR